MKIRSGDITRFLYFVAVDSTDLKTRETGLTTFTVYYELDNGTATAYTTPTVTESDATNMPGVYVLTLDESGSTTLAAGKSTGEVALHITQASMAPVTRVVELYRPDGATDCTASGVPTTTVIPASDLTEVTTDHYDNMILVALDGAQVGQAQKITGSTTGSLTTEAWTTAVASGDRLMIIGKAP